MLSNFKEFVKQHESDIILTVALILVALISFGIGLLVDFSDNEKPIIIQNPEFNPQQTASIQESANQPTKQRILVGSINSNKYHWPDCPSAKKITPENQIWFNSEQEAKEAGYVRCGNFDKYAPSAN